MPFFYSSPVPFITLFPPIQLPPTLSLCPSHLTLNHPCFYNTSSFIKCIYFPPFKFTPKTFYHSLPLLLSLWVSILIWRCHTCNGRVTVVPSTCRLTTPRGSAGKVERANRWRLLCEGGCGVERGSSAAESWECACVCLWFSVCLCTCIHLFLCVCKYVLCVFVPFVFVCGGAGVRRRCGGEGMAV